MTNTTILAAEQGLETTGVEERSPLVAAAAKHAGRLLRRYRPPLAEPARHELVVRLVNAYPCHCFPLDHEELEELGFPVRRPDPREDAILELIAAILLDSQPEPVMTLVTGEAGCGSGEDQNEA